MNKSVFLFLILAAFSHSINSKEIEFVFPPLPNNELIVYFLATTSDKTENSSGEEVKFQSLQVNSIYSESGDLFFNLRSRIAGSFALEIINRIRYSCKTNEFSTLSSSFYAFEKGIEFKDPDYTLKAIESVYFSEPHQNLINILNGTCNIWSNNQIDNNTVFVTLGNGLHNLVLENAIKDKDVVNNMFRIFNIDYLLKRDENMKIVYSDTLNYIVFQQCGSNSSCWEKVSFSSQFFSLYVCMNEQDFEQKRKSEFCSNIEYSFE